MMPVTFGLGELEAEFWHVAFLMTRIGAAMLAAPMFGAMSVPTQVRVILAGALAIFVANWLPVESPASIFSLDGMLAVAGEVVIGLSLGFALQIAFAAPVVAAEIIGGTMGLSMAMASDPNGGGQVSAFGQYFSILLMLIFLAVGGHLQWLALVMESYRIFPPGQAWLDADRFGMIAGFGGAMFATGLAIALPVTIMLLLVQILTGILSRSAPALNIFALGLPLGVMAGLVALIVTAPLLFSQLEDVASDALGQAEQVLRP